MSAPALVVLGEGSLEAARRVKARIEGASIHGLSGRVAGADIAFADFGETLRRLYRDDVPIVAFCAAGIVIRTLAPLLQDKRAEPPVLAIAEDGSAVVPLLGGLRGVNDLARRIGEALGTVPAITTTGEVRFGATLEHPPAGYEIRNPGAGKRFMSDVLAGERIRLTGEAPWLARTRLPFDDAGKLSIAVTVSDDEPAENQLVFHPRAIAVHVSAGAKDLVGLVREALARQKIAPQSVAAIVAAEKDAAAPEIHAVARDLARPLRLVVGDVASTDAHVTVVVATAPIDIATIGRARGRLSVVGIGPGSRDWRTPEAERALVEAEDILGYETYTNLAGPFRDDQRVHSSDNREELDRARHAFSLAAQGRSVAVVSSGDPGIFAMAAAVLEALEASSDPAWHGVQLGIVPGITAAQAAASRIGAPLGHDFCVVSLSDNLKPWDIIERRLDLAAQADLVLAFYNPISKARPHQLGRAIEIVRTHRGPQTPVVLGRDVGRPGETTRTLPLSDLSPDMVDMRTVVLIGSSTTRIFPRSDGGGWVYTPRSYPAL